jgi:hypothetical protein
MDLNMWSTLKQDLVVAEDGMSLGFLATMPAVQ